MSDNEVDLWKCALSKISDQSYLCDPLDSRPPCADCTRLMEEARKAALAPLCERLRVMETDMRDCSQGDLSEVVKARYAERVFWADQLAMLLKHFA